MPDPQLPAVSRLHEDLNRIRESDRLFRAIKLEICRELRLAVSSGHGEILITIPTPLAPKVRNWIHAADPDYTVITSLHKFFKQKTNLYLSILDI